MFKPEASLVFYNVKLLETTETPIYFIAIFYSLE